MKQNLGYYRTCTRTRTHGHSTFSLYLYTRAMCLLCFSSQTEHTHTHTPPQKHIHTTTDTRRKEPGAVRYATHTHAYTKYPRCGKLTFSICNCNCRLTKTGVSPTDQTEEPCNRSILFVLLFRFETCSVAFLFCASFLLWPG